MTEVVANQEVKQSIMEETPKGVAIINNEGELEWSTPKGETRG